MLQNHIKLQERVVFTWNFICVCFLGRKIATNWYKTLGNGWNWPEILYVYVFLGEKTDSVGKILKKSNAGSFYGVIDDQNDP